jgi:imidazolonepropionase
MRRVVLSLLIVLSLVVPALAQQTQKPAPKTVYIRAGRLFDGTGDKVRENMVIMVVGDRIQNVALANSISIPADATVLDLSHATVLPGLIDCHTHLVYAGDRAREFELRLQGASYEEIARAGGGIRSTVAQTRAASEDDLVSSAQSRVDAFRREGVTTLEVKSGYGLDAANEAKMLRAARRLKPGHDVIAG